MHRKKQVTSWYVATLLLLNANTVVFAQDPIHKMGRGVGNILTCWIEVPKNFQRGTQKTNPFLGAGWGLVKGTGLAVTRLAVGAYEAVTLPLPYPSNYSSPYEGMELEDYAWE